MLLMVEKGIRGGITQEVKHYAQANYCNYMKDLYNPEEESIYFQYLNGQWLKIYQHMDLNGRMQRTLPLKK